MDQVYFISIRKDDIYENIGIAPSRRERVES